MTRTVTATKRRVMARLPPEIASNSGSGRERRARRAPANDGTWLTRPMVPARPPEATSELADGRLAGRRAGRSLRQEAPHARELGIGRRHLLHHHGHARARDGEE